MKKIILKKETIDEILKLYKSGLGNTKIMKLTGVSKRHIIRTLKENNIPIIGPKRFFQNDDFFDNIDNEEKSYWLGFLFADGFVRKRKEKYGIIRLKLSSKDSIHVKLFKESIKSTNVIKTFDEYYKYKGEIKKASSTSIDINSTKMVNDLIKHGCVENKTKILKFPSTIPENLIRHFIRGYFDGDGSVYFSANKKNIFSFSICSGSDLLLKGIEKEFIKNGITKTSFKKANAKYLYILNVGRTNDLKRIYHYFYNNSSFYLNRKKEIFNNIEKFNGKYE